MKLRKREIGLWLALVLLVSVFFVVPTQIQAAENPSLTSKSYNLTYFKSKDLNGNTTYVPIRNFPKNGKITKVTSSNTKVVKVSVSENMSNTIKLVAIKAGKETVSVKVKAAKKTYNLKCAVFVNNYENPVSSLKLGNQQYKTLLKDKNCFNIKYKKNSKYKVSVKCNKNWKLQHIGYFEGSRYRSIENNEKITVKEVNSYLVLSFYNTKTKATEDIRVEFTK